ncbi:MAG: hypothetical protein IKM83_00540 [Paludibacteraceae bacterium]|nr:hypothetical protein [Paludibacteraceae bacterium]
MKKIFSIFGMVLVSLAMYATVETKDITWTLTDGGNTFALDAWGNMATKWGWTEGCAEYDQLVFEFDNPTGDIMVSVNFNDGDYVSASAALHAGSNSLAIDVKADVLQSVDVKNYSGSAQTITLNRMYLRRAVGPKQPETLWSGSITFDDWKAWGDRLVIAPEKFAGIHAGDIIEFEYSLIGESDNKINALTPYNSRYPEFLGALNANNYDINKDANPSKVNFAILSSTDITNLQTDGGLSINALNITLTAVKLHKHEVLWSDVQATGEWAHAVEVAAAKLADLKVGNIICVRVSEIGTADGPRVTLADGTWTTLVDGERYFQGGDEAPMVVEFPVTYKMEQQLRGKNLIVRGVNYTMTDIYVKEGTPTNTVAAYLPVTSAGMATFIVPFNVPSLPDGVQAYELTNSGDPTIWATEVNALEADKPVLIVAAQNEDPGYEFISEDGASDDISGKTGTYANGALIGTYTEINPLAQKTGDDFNYVLNNQGGNVAFYQVRDNTCSVPAYRAYLSCAHDASDNGANFAPKMRIVFHKDAPTGIESQELKVNSQKIIRDGQILIIRDNKKYNVLGQQL